MLIWAKHYNNYIFLPLRWLSILSLSVGLGSRLCLESCCLLILNSTAIAHLLPILFMCWCYCFCMEYRGYCLWCSQFATPGDISGIFLQDDACSPCVLNCVLSYVWFFSWIFVCSNFICVSLLSQLWWLHC